MFWVNNTINSIDMEIDACVCEISTIRTTTIPLAYLMTILSCAADTDPVYVEAANAGHGKFI